MECLKILSQFIFTIISDKHFHFKDEDIEVQRLSCLRQRAEAGLKLRCISLQYQQTTLPPKYLTTVFKTRTLWGGGKIKQKLTCWKEKSYQRYRGRRFIQKLYISIFTAPQNIVICRYRIHKPLKKEKLLTPT